MNLASLQQQLSTPSGFASAVSAKRGVFSAAITCFVLSAIGIALTLFQLGGPMDWNWKIMFEAYFQTGTFVDSEGTIWEFKGSSRGAVWHYLYVWGPVVLLPLGIILMIIHFVTRGKAGANLFGDFQSRGWIGRQAPIALKVQNGNSQVALALIANAAAPAEQVYTLSQQYSQWVSTLDKKTLKQTSQAAAKAGIMNGIPGSSLSNGLPDDMIAAPKQGDGEFVVVIPPAAGATGATKILPIKIKEQASAGV